MIQFVGRVLKSLWVGRSTDGLREAEGAVEPITLVFFDEVYFQI
jgi:hypothetical protein